MIYTIQCDYILLLYSPRTNIWFVRFRWFFLFEQLWLNYNEIKISVYVNIYLFHPPKFLSLDLLCATSTYIYLCLLLFAKWQIIIQLYHNNISGWPHHRKCSNFHWFLFAFLWETLPPLNKQQTLFSLQFKEEEKQNACKCANRLSKYRA